MERTAERLRLWATTVTAVAAAAGAIAGLLHYAGPLASAGVLGGIVTGVLAWVLQQAIVVRRTVQAVHYHVVPNGHEGDLPPDLRGRPLREIVSGCVQRLDAGTERFREIGEWQERHEAQHGGVTSDGGVARSTAPRMAGQE